MPGPMTMGRKCFRNAGFTLLYTMEASEQPMLWVSSRSSSSQRQSSMRWVLDTTAFSHLMRRDTAIENLIKKYPPKNILAVPPVIAEIQYGIKRLNPSSKKYLLLALEKTGGNKTKAAEFLNLSFRSFRYRLKKFESEINGMRKGA